MGLLSTIEVELTHNVTDSALDEAEKVLFHDRMKDGDWTTNFSFIEASNKYEAYCYKYRDQEGVLVYNLMIDGTPVDAWKGNWFKVRDYVAKKYIESIK